MRMVQAVRILRTQLRMARSVFTSIPLETFWNNVSENNLLAFQDSYPDIPWSLDKQVNASYYIRQIIRKWPNMSPTAVNP